jgi:pimeloyl-ACP methyl ester carboxylesterase
MTYKSKIFIPFILFFCGFVSLFSCKEKEYRHDDIIYVPSDDTTIMVKISYPEQYTPKDKIIVWSEPPLESDFLPDSITDNRKLRANMVLRTELLKSGYINIEYIGRNDSIIYNNRKYRASDANSKARCLENLLAYINTAKQLTNKKIILAGHSEGGEINSIVAGEKQFNISAILQLACLALPGKETLDYQREQIGYKDLLLLSGGGNQEYMDKTLNKLSSLDSYHKANIDGVKQFFKENIEPLEIFIHQFENKDSIYLHMDLYLKNRWEKENKETKEQYNNDYENYYQAFAGNITPHQITLRVYNPKKRYPFIKCPVLAVHGTADKRINCYPNLKNMELLLKEGGNQRFEKMILEGYNHDLAKGSDGHDYVTVEDGTVVPVSSKPNLYIEDRVINRIIEWLDKQ